MDSARRRPGAGRSRALLSRLAAVGVLAGLASLAAGHAWASVSGVDSDAAAASAASGEGIAIDSRRSSASFLVTVRMRGPAEGRMPGVSGQLRGNATAGWRVQVRLDAKGLRFNGPRWMENASRSASFLSVDRYPSIRFDSDPFDDALLKSGGPLEGALTLRGQRRTVAFTLLPSACARPGRDCDIRVEGAVSRRDFGMTAHGTMVLDRVDLHIRVRLRGAAP